MIVFCSTNDLLGARTLIHEEWLLLFQMTVMVTHIMMLLWQCYSTHYNENTSLYKATNMTFIWSKTKTCIIMNPIMKLSEQFGLVSAAKTSADNWITA